MVVEPRKRRTFLYTVAGITFVEACLGLAVLIGIHITTEVKSDTSNAIISTTVYETTANNSDPTSTLSTKVMPSETTSVVNSTGITNPGDVYSSPSTPIGDFALFISTIRSNVELYAGNSGYLAWFGTYTTLDALWIFSLIGIFIGAHNIPNNYKYLLPYIFVTALACLIDIVTTAYFTYMVINDETVTLTARNWDDFESVISLIFVPIYCSKLGVYWIVNIVFLVKIHTCYKLFKDKYENPFGDKQETNYELRKYDSDDDITGFDNNGYTENPEKSNWTFHHPKQNGQMVNGYNKYTNPHEVSRQNSSSSDRSLNSRIEELPPPKIVSSILKSNANEHFKKRLENVIKPSSVKQNQANLANRRPTGYYENNEMPIRNSITESETSELQENRELTLPISAYNKMPEEKLAIPRVFLRQANE